MRDKPSLQFDDDARLMIRARDGDRLAYDQVYSRYFRIIVSFLVRRHTPHQVCEDLAQEVFARVWSRRHQYRPLAPLKNYLLGVAVNVLRESRAQAHDRTIRDLHRLETVADTSRPSPPAQAQTAEQLQAVRALMESLPAQQRQAVELVHLAGLSPQEAARRLGCSVKTLYSHLCVARQKLRMLARRSL
jgi:RNA polymerase sigma-70 factor (ECF subfamily)